jgi:hypothetical protein
VTSVRASETEADTFQITMGLHQRPALSLYMFSLVMNEVTKDIQGDFPWCMLFADDVMLVDEPGSA